MSLRYYHHVYYLSLCPYNITIANQEGNHMKDAYKSQYQKFGLNVVYYRKMMRITQLQLAELLDIQRSHISAIELGNVGVSFDLIFKMCEVFQIKPKDLFDFRD